MKNQLLKYSFHAIIAASILSGSCTRRTEKNKDMVFGDSIYLKNVPSQPGEDTWKFIEDLKSPMWTHHNWIKAVPEHQLADLAAGVKLQTGFPDPKGRLETAYEDLRSFLTAGDVSCEGGKYLVETVEDKKLTGESFRLEIQSGSCRIISGNVDGVRRGIFYLEDEMLRQRGPFLTIGKVEEHPIIQRRISRCFFGPIKRPPGMRDELMDDVDYYPDQYLNRLAHEGVNGLWLTVEFRDLVATSVTPEAGINSEKRLAKLRQTVEKCLRYGIRTYIFCIEPRAWDVASPVIKQYPELAGVRSGDKNYFCPMSKTAQTYLYETVNKIFRAVPELGGMINITHGERETTCLSAVSCTSDYTGKIACPRCSGKKPWEILYTCLSAMEKGMHDAAPEAELISWLYMPQPQRFVTGDSCSLGEWVYDLPAHTPERVILQFNFESGVIRTEFGKLLVGGDYWISNPGPSNRFECIANIARKKGTKVSAKIQTGNSHEVASVPFVPVPSLLYRKFRDMKDLGVSHTMLCWYFGNYPGLMNKAAGLLSTEPFPENEDLFLNQLASIYWKKEDVLKVVRAWKLFSEGYQNYPLVNLFQYYGPIHDGPVWSLLLRPADAPLAPTWQIRSASTRKPWPPSGDRIGECIGEVLTLDEIVELTRRMTKSWDKGMAIFSGIKNNYNNEPERLLDIGVAQAIGIQLRSGYNILNFYLLREKMFRMEGRERLEILDQLSSIIREEIELDKQLLILCEKDSRLGFHSEAEGYKYFPEKIKWRMEQLNNVLANDAPGVKKIILKDRLLFPEYTGLKPEGPVADCIASDSSIWSDTSLVLPIDLKWQACDNGSEKTTLQWASAYSRDDIYIVVCCKECADSALHISPIEGIEVKIEPQRLYPASHFIFDSRNTIKDGDPVHILGYPLVYNAGIRQINKEGIWYGAVRIPFEKIGLNAERLHPLRINVTVHETDGRSNSWLPDNPITERLILGSDNPADLGWLLFLEKYPPGEQSPDWFKEAKFGMFIHWGPYSRLAGEWNGRHVEVGKEAEWIMKDLSIPVNDYRELAHKMNPARFDAHEWVRLAKSTGMKYIVITAKHHDGFAMYKSRVTSYNIFDWTQFKRDPLKELSIACAEEGIKFCIYYSHREDWDHPGGYGNNWDYDNDWGNDFYDHEKFTRYIEEKAKPQLRELLTNYGPVGLVWFDRGMYTPGQGKEFVDLVKELQPATLINSRVGNYGQELLGDYQSMSDNGMPPGGLNEYWESAQTLNETWGFSKFDTLWKSPETVIQRLVEIVSRGGNYLLNIGPKGDGEIPDATVEILRKVGPWVGRNAESIYGTTANPFGELSWGYCTVKGSKVYLFVRDWPQNGILTLPGLHNPVTSAYLLPDKSAKLPVIQTERQTRISLPSKPSDDPISVLALEIDGSPKVDPPIVTQNDTGSIELNYLKVITHGKTMTRFNRKGGFHISKWTGPEDSAEWFVHLDNPGTFQVNITYAANKEWEGKPFEIIIGSNSFKMSVICTGEWFEYQKFPVGYIKLKDPADFTVTLRPSESTDTYLMYLQSITLNPVKVVKKEGWGVVKNLLNHEKADLLYR